ncbi:MAG: hypothetical protein SFV21_17235, partial [Rhodospirillaceae bacterium]|nr:hypothetical protein [Rhodospirillaceae bacterium]
MTRVQILAPLRSSRFALALLAGCAALGAAPSRAADRDPAELFDPAAVARGLCAAPTEKSGLLATLAQVAAASGASAVPARPPLYTDLGDITFKISTARPEAQRYFDQGLRLAYGFNHAEAIRAFKAAQSIDPTCAMCFWGEGWALGPTINLLMNPADNAAALAATARARDLAPQATKKEQALIAALAARYGADDRAKRTDLDKSFSDAMAKVHAAYAGDADVTAIFVDAAMTTTPWDYWRGGGTEPAPGMSHAYPALEQALAAHPGHAGLIHYYIHVMEQAAAPAKAELYADRLASLMPGAGHMVHMPSHTYFVLGRYKDSLAVNIDAVAADEAFMAQAEPSAMYRFGYYPHNIHFALESAAMIGEGRQALVFADKLAAALPAESFRQVVMSQPIGLAPMFAKLRFADPDAILALANPGDDVPFMKGVWLHALGIGHVLKGDLAAAKIKADELAGLRATADLDLLESNAVPAGAVLEIAEHVLRGRIAAVAKDWATAIGH